MPRDRKLASIALALALALPLAAAHAGPVPLPKAEFTVDELVQKFRIQLQNKTDELLKNYVVTLTPGHIGLSSTSPQSCDGLTVPADADLARIELSTTMQGDRLSETLRYTGCRGQASLTEIVQTRGTHLEPISWADVQAGRRSFALRKSETERHASYIDATGRAFAAIDTVREARGVKTTISLDGKPALVMLEVEGEAQSEIRYETKGVDFKFARGESAYSWKAAEEESETFVATAYRSGQVVYRITSMQPISYGTYSSAFNEGVTSPILNPLNKAFELILTELPVTSAISGGGGQNQRIIDELKLAFLRLTNGIEYNQVKLLVQEYLNAVISGQIIVIDKRPPK